MLSLQGRVLESGVDWITATAMDRERQGRLRHVGLRLLGAEIEKGDECKPWHHKGYEGFTTGHCEVATRHDSTIVRLHSQLAKTDWFDIFQECDNVSRLDLQVTIVNDEHDGCKDVHRVQKHAQTAKVYGKPLEWHLRWDSSRGDTIYLGREQSDRFMRVYCKFHQSKLDYYARALRLEGQFNRKLAFRYANALADGRVAHDAVQSFVHDLAQSRGIVLQSVTGDLTHLSAPPIARSRDTWLEWLAKCVGPRVQRDIAKHGPQDVLRALGFSKPAEIDSILLSKTDEFLM